jgi:membrane protease YdiL (CAAX protease family)
MSAPVWALNALVAGPRGLPRDVSPAALMVVCPGLAALFLAWSEEGPAGSRRLLKRLVDIRRVRGARWYPAAAVPMPALACLSYGMMRLRGRELPDPRVPLRTLPPLLLLLLLAAAAEELGWTGYATDPLQERLGPAATGLVLGAVTSVWHLPPWWQAHGPAWTAWQTLFTIALRVLTVRLYNGSGHSVGTATVLHTMSNVCSTLFPRWGSHYDPAVTGPLTALAALAAWAAPRPALIRGAAR